MMAESAEVLREEYTKTGLATDEDIDHYVVRSRDSRVWSVGLLCHSVGDGP